MKESPPNPPFVISGEQWYRTHDLFVWCKVKTAEANWIESYLARQATFEAGAVELGGFLLVRGDVFIEAVAAYNEERERDRERLRQRESLLATRGGLFQ